MANLTNNSNVCQVGSVLTGEQLPILSGAKLYQGAMVCPVLASGYAVRAGTANTGPVCGVAQAEAATPSSDGAVNTNLLTGVFALPVHATRPPTIAHVNKVVYASDDNTISYLYSDGTPAGVLVGFHADGRALVAIMPESMGVLARYKKFELPISAGILAAGTPMAAWADNASSAPGVTLANNKAMGLRWNNNASQVAVFLRANLPFDIDPSEDVVVEVFASKTGATVGDATTFTITAFNNATGALHDADADFGGATSAMTGDATAKTIQRVTRSLAVANLGAAGEPVTFSIKPTDGTLGTDDVIVHGINLIYRARA